MIANNETFDNVIWTDETTIYLENYGSYQYRKVGEPNPRKPKPKHPQKLNVWGAITRKGRGNVVIFNGNVNQEFYTDSILRDTVIPLIADYFPNGARYQQDSAPAHRSRRATGFMHDNGIVRFPFPPESPDLNPIESIWNCMKEYCRKKA